MSTSSMSPSVRLRNLSSSDLGSRAAKKSKRDSGYRSSSIRSSSSLSLDTSLKFKSAPRAGLPKPESVSNYALHPHFAQKEHLNIHKPQPPPISQNALFLNRERKSVFCPFHKKTGKTPSPAKATKTQTTTAAKVSKTMPLKIIMHQNDLPHGWNGVEYRGGHLNHIKEEGEVSDIKTFVTDAVDKIYSEQRFDNWKQKLIKSSGSVRVLKGIHQLERDAEDQSPTAHITIKVGKHRKPLHVYLKHTPKYEKLLGRAMKKIKDPSKSDREKIAAYINKKKSLSPEKKANRMKRTIGAKKWTVSRITY